MAPAAARTIYEFLTEFTKDKNMFEGKIVIAQIEEKAYL